MSNFYTLEVLFLNVFMRVLQGILIPTNALPTYTIIMAAFLKSSLGLMGKA